MKQIIQQFLIKTAILLTLITPSSGVVIGDSTVANYLGGTAIADLLFTSTELTAGYASTSLAVPGETINQQKAHWDALSTKTSAKWVIVQIGLNDLDPTETAAVALARYQALIDDINATKQAGAKVIVSTMTPCRQRLIDVYGAINGPVSYQKWLDMNDAIMGNGAHAITGVDYRLSAHTAALNDGSGNLLPQYEAASDHIHENNAARQIDANDWRTGLVALGLLQ